MRDPTTTREGKTTKVTVGRQKHTHMEREAALIEEQECSLF